MNVYFRRDGYGDIIEGFISSKERDGKFTAVVGFEYRDHIEGDFVDPMRLKPDFVQNFVDAAWEIGIKPTALKAELEKPALMRHLEDMRAIAFFKIGATKP